MKKAILTTFILLALLWCLGEPIDGNLDLGWCAGELLGFAVIYLCGRALSKLYPEIIKK